MSSLSAILILKKRRLTLSAETAGISLYVKRVCQFLDGPLYVKMRIADYVKRVCQFLDGPLYVKTRIADVKTVSRVR
jgi:hypothetical protein